MANLELNVSTEKYQARISTLQGYVRQLETMKSNYQAKMREIPSIWSDDQATEFYNVINNNISKVQQAIDAANLNIDQLQNIITNQQSTAASVTSIVNDAATIAEKLFI